MTDAKKASAADNGRRMTLWDHLEELRWVIFKSLAVLALATAAGLAFTEPVYALLQRPLGRLEEQGVELILATPLDAFLVKMKLAFLAGAVVSAPFVLGFIWSFVAPGLTAREKGAVRLGVGFGVLLFCAGIVFGYCLLPFGLAFLVSFTSPGVRNLWPMQRYIGFCLHLLLAFGLVFQLPVVLILLVRLGIVRSDTLAKRRPYAVVAALVVAAFLTPPDCISQIMLAVPILLLYEVSIVAGRWQERRLERATGEQMSADDPALPSDSARPVSEGTETTEVY